MSVPCCFSWWIQGAIRGGLLFTSLFTTFVVFREGMASVQLWLGKATAVSWQLMIQHDPALAIKSSKMVPSPPGSVIFVFQTVTGRKIVCSYAKPAGAFPDSSGLMRTNPSSRLGRWTMRNLTTSHNIVARCSEQMVGHFSQQFLEHLPLHSDPPWNSSVAVPSSSSTAPAATRLP